MDLGRGAARSGELTFLVLPSSSQAPNPFRLWAGEAIGKRCPEGGLDAVPASWTMGVEEDGPSSTCP